MSDRMKRGGRAVQRAHDQGVDVDVDVDYKPDPARLEHAADEVDIVRSGSTDGWARVGEVLLDLLDSPAPSPASRSPRPRRRP